MNHLIKSTLAGTAALLTTAVVSGHHVDTPLSYIHGENILGEVTYYHGGPFQGIPGYILSGQEHHPGSTWALTDGATFSVTDAHGSLDTVTFGAADFADIHAATTAEVLASINGQLTHFQAAAHNSFLHFRGTEGGAAVSLAVADGAHEPLGVLGVAPATAFGQEDLVLDLSIPGAGHHGEGEAQDLAHHPYLVLMSTRDSSFQIGEHTVPIGRDRTLRLGMRLIAVGAAPSFQGTLDHDADAVATFDPTLLDLMFDTVPSEVYFAYVVFSMDGSQVEFVSNRFTLRVQ